jgi:hypothetical protein
MNYFIKLFFFIFALQWDSLLVAQPCFFKKRAFNSNDTTFVELKQVLVSDTLVQHGSYLLEQKILKSHQRICPPHPIIAEDSLYYYVLVQQGFYKKNQKEGMWIENFGSGFYRAGFYEKNQKIGTWKETFQNELCGMGNYAENEKKGIWKYYDIYPRSSAAPNLLYCTYDYDKDTLILAPLSYPRYSDKVDSYSADTCFPASHYPVYPYGGLWALSQSIDKEVIFRLHSMGVPDNIGGRFMVTIQVHMDTFGETHLQVQSVRGTEDPDDGSIRQAYQKFLAQIPIHWLKSKKRNKSSCSMSFYFLSKFRSE